MLSGLAQRWSLTWRRANAALLRLFLRLVPSETHRVFALTLIAGASCGLAAVFFHLSIIGTEKRLIGTAMSASGRSWIWWTILTPTVGGLLSGVLLQYAFPGARGSGIPQVKVAYAIKDGRVPLREAVGKFLVGVLQIGTGSSLGREGPTVHICAGVASTLGRSAALSRESLKRLLPVGAAAGIAAAFNAPIAAITFTLEEVVGDLDQAVLAWIVVAAAIAAGIERAILGEHPVFTISKHYGLEHFSSLLFYAALGVAAALVSLAFTESLLSVRKWFQRMSLIPAWTRPGAGGLVTGLLAVAAFYWLGVSGVTGGGYGTLSLALSGGLAFRALLVLCVFKLIATVFSYGSGGAGGIFAPALFIGGMLGGAFGYFDHSLFHHGGNELGSFALVGMGAVFAGIIRAPITSVLIIFEMTGSYELILPLMISNMTSYALARHFRPTPIYEALLEQDDIHLPHRDGRVSHALERLTIGSAMTTRPVAISATATIADALQQVESHDYSTYPVIDSEGRFLGLVTKARLRRNAAAEGAAKQRVNSIIERVSHVQPEHTLVRAVVRMEKSGRRQLAVVDRQRGNKLIGLLTMSDIVRAHAHAALEVGDPDRTVSPGFIEGTDAFEEKS
ncbi:MAG TPA: chloride channel protein [Pyrinomonadaceae bacterium]|nr:chloride channel protein [Pyrinomonadaceae bacterium]